MIVVAAWRKTWFHPLWRMPGGSDIEQRGGSQEGSAGRPASQGR